MKTFVRPPDARLTAAACASSRSFVSIGFELAHSSLALLQSKSITPHCAAASGSK